MTDPKLTPPPELVQQWAQIPPVHQAVADHWQHIATRAAQWGADRELDACCEWLSNEVLCESNVHRFLRAARRPKPPSLKEQALEIVRGTPVNSAGLYSHEDVETIRRALEALPDD
jgi:hypothetical protein